jgi:hypothetical protein
MMYGLVEFGLVPVIGLLKIACPQENALVIKAIKRILYFINRMFLQIS